ncbi:MAG: ATP-binding cassette domain-containing protein [Chloroflexi bacterium]|nr:ATP-binding cassette domain-containing protein [Chloroflexota bacterium]
MAVLEIDHLTKRFGGVTAVDSIELTVADGEFVCILGPSGCGKSTLLRMIAGFEQPTSGDIRIDRDSVVALPANKRPTAMVFQKYTLWPHMKVYDNIAFGLQLRKKSRDEIQRKVQDSLEMVGLAGYDQRLPAQLSGGQQQRVALARALVLEPKILLLDEPFSSLDAILRVHLREELRRIQRRLHITAIFVTHDQEEALTLADRIAVMSAGKVEQLDAPSSIYANPKTLFVADFIGSMNLIETQSREGQISVGSVTIEAPAEISNGSVTVAIRPEDFALLTGPHEGALRGVVEQISDLGHYRRAILEVDQIGSVKIYLPKAFNLAEGAETFVYLRRCLVYQNNKVPLEITRALPSEALTLQDS